MPVFLLPSLTSNLHNLPLWAIIPVLGFMVGALVMVAYDLIAEWLIPPRQTFAIVCGDEVLYGLASAMIVVSYWVHHYRLSTLVFVLTLVVGLAMATVGVVLTIKKRHRGARGLLD